MLVIIVKNENKAFNYRLYKNIRKFRWQRFLIFGNFLATFWHSSEELSSILRAQSGKAKCGACFLKPLPYCKASQVLEKSITLMFMSSSVSKFTLL